MTTMMHVAPSQICSSPFNHRKSFTGLDELGASLLEKGMINPLTVRPTPEDSEATEPYQLIAGERRWRAALQVGLAEVPVIVRDLSDKEVIEVQLIENVQRVDVHPMEEAEGYDELLTKHGYDVDMIVAKTGKSRTAVYNRIKLLKLCPKVRAAFLADKINASHAELIARVPTSKLQDQLLADILKGRQSDARDIVAIGRERPSPTALEADQEIGVQPLSVREARALALRKYMLRLELAKFDLADATLVPKAGACTTCVHRTGNQPDLFDDVPSTDVCTNPPCYEKKRDAQVERELAEWKAKGAKTLSPDESEKEFQQDWQGKYTLVWSSKYSDADGKAPYDVDRKQRTWEQLFGSRDKIPTVVAIDPAGEVRHIVPKDAALKALRKSGVLKEKTSKSNDPSSSSSGKPKPPTEAELVEARIYKRVLEALADELDPALAKGDVDTWRAIASTLLLICSLGDAYRLLAAVGYRADSPEAASKIVASAKTASDLRRMVIMAVFAERLSAAGDTTQAFGKVCKPFGIDPKKLATAAAAEVKAELEKQATEQSTADTKKPAKKAPTKRKAA